jgi:hypothetical protein
MFSRVLKISIREGIIIKVYPRVDECWDKCGSKGQKNDEVF